MTVIFRTVSGIVLPLMVILALELHVTGHNAPGGGFIAGVLLASSITMVLLAFGRDFLEGLGATGNAFSGLFAAGLLLVVLSGFGPMVFGENFLTQHVVHLGGFELSTALSFDTGIMLAVAGAIMSIVLEVSGR